VHCIFLIFNFLVLYLREKEDSFFSTEILFARVLHISFFNKSSIGPFCVLQCAFLGCSLEFAGFFYLSWFLFEGFAFAHDFMHVRCNFFFAFVSACSEELSKNVATLAEKLRE